MAMNSYPATGFAIVFLLALTPAVQSAAEEARCAELGSRCICSEPLDFSYDGNVPLTFNPPDSASKQCNGGNAITLLTGAQVDTILASSVGLDGPTHVIRRKAGGGNVRTSVGRDFTGSTYCSRIYFREDVDTVLPQVGGDDLKLMLFSGSSNGPGPDAEFQFRHGGLECLGIKKDAGWTHDTTVFPSFGDLITIEDCSDNGWCQAEMCFDHNWDGTNRLQWRCRMVALGTNKQMEFAEVSNNAHPTAHSGDSRNFLGRLHTDFADVPDNTTWERKYSHGMIAIQSPADPTFWIGPAYEIEGSAPSDPGGGGSDLGQPGRPYVVGE